MKRMSYQAHLLMLRSMPHRSYPLPPMTVSTDQIRQRAALESRVALGLVRQYFPWS